MKTCFTALLFVAFAGNLFSQQDLIGFVNPLIGTQRMGHTFPGATVPFGMVQLSPDTDTISYEKEGKYNGEVYAYCSGYQYDDPTIVGFSHTHFSGTGHSDLGDFLVMPTSGKARLNPGTASHPESGYRSAYAHANEMAQPAYYKVRLDDDGILAELTATERVGFHRYTFSKNDTANIILDLIHGIYNYEDKNVWTFIRVENDTLVTGYRQTSGWARTRTVYFAMAFDNPVVEYGHRKYDNAVYRGFYRKFDETKNFPEMAGEKIRAYFRFLLHEGESLRVKFALSSTSTEGALKNLQTEIPHWDFDRIVNESQAKWNKELGKVAVEMMTPADMTTFYTALYHTFLSPTIYMDVDGAYRGLDQNNHVADGFTNYTTFSLWDTYRALHPLFNLVQPSRNSDMIRSMLAHYDQSVHPMLPVWSHHANENWCMIGYHAVSVIADAAVKNVGNFDRLHALEACVKTAGYDLFDGIKYYETLGYVPEDKNSSSVSKTLEYAYNDWTIAQLARITGNAEVEKQFAERSLNFRKVYDKEIGFMRPRLASGEWKTPFDPLNTHGQGFIEGNAWNYSLYVPHRIPEMITMMGGPERFTARLDSLFIMHLPDENFKDTEDITRDGIIGCYVHGNEPGHHIPYLYNRAGKPWKTQEKVRMIMREMYGDTPDGLCGNDDCGQMSAWYVFSALGFYPVCPGSEEYAIGSPLVVSAKITLENGRKVGISVENQSEENIFIRKIILNGDEYDKNYFSHSNLINGAEITFVMGARPEKSWGKISPEDE
ncbi:MAG: GH92 family glycosyl hydrolase [Bacteroidales bacterium]|nr:GH92 family glycosyl hydrolase [Bacteroidales bacterium]